MAAIRRRILEIEDNPALQRNSASLHQAYAQIEAPWLDSSLVLRTDTRVSLNASKQHFLTTASSSLNRFLAAQLRRLDAFDFLPGRIDPEHVRRAGERFEVTIAGRKRPFDRIVRRHGPTSALQTDFPLIWKALEPQQNARVNMPTLMDDSRKRHWRNQTFDPPAPPRPPRPESHLVHVLDRVLYWDRIRMTCDHLTAHYSFVLRGEPHQGVNYFLSRVDRSFDRDGHTSHKIIKVFSDADIGRAIIAEDWARHTCHAAGAGVETLAQAIRESARREAVMLIFRHEHGPLHCQRGSDDRVGLDEPERAGLVEFLATYLPAALVEADPEHPVRVLVPIEYLPGERGTDPLLRGVVGALRANPRIRYEEVPEFSWPSFGDVWISIRASFGSKAPPERLEVECEAVYDRHDPKNGDRFEDLADALERTIEPYGDPQ